MKNKTKIELTTKPIEVPPVISANITPEFIRLPKVGSLCLYTGLTRSKLNELVLPSEKNDFRPPVKSVSLRQRGMKKACRLIVFDSLIGYLRSFISPEVAQ